MSIAIAQEFDTADVLAPEQPLTHRGQRAVARHADVADRQVAARRRSERHGPGRSHSPAVRHPRAAARASARRDAGAGEERGGHGHGRLSIHADRRRPRSRRCAISKRAATSAPRRCRSRSTTSYMSALRAQTRDVFRERVAQRVLASHRRARDARSARAGHRVGQGDVPLRPARKRQERHGRRHRPGARRRYLRAARASTSTARSSRCSIPSRTRRTTPDEEGSIIRSDTDIDGRWIRVGRPVITVGGELTLEMLDLRYKELSAFYEAPVHLKANGGVLVVDDFGRQRVPARDLLNRWIVPLESRVDYLNLISGRKFQVPFDVLVVFATNLEPRSLADEAFLRRIPYKILAKNPSLEQFSKIFEMNCRRHKLAFDPVDRRSTCTTSTTSAASSRCARAIRAISPTRSSTCAAITGARRS